MLEDPFSSRQPRLSFADELSSPVHKCAPKGWNEREADEGEVKVCGKNIIKDFPDERGLLETAYADLERFFDVDKMEDGDVAFKTVKNALMEKES